MTAGQLRALQARHAFDSTPRQSQLGNMHVPFDHLTDSGRYEGRFVQALRHGETVAVIGPSGGGKSSIVEHVLFTPNLQDLAPIKIRVGLDPDVIESPSRFLDHVLRIVARFVQHVDGGGRHLRALGRGRGDGRRTASVTVGPPWLHADLSSDLATVLQQPAGIDARNRVQQMLELIAANGVVPVLVLDDTDHWLSIPGLRDTAGARAQFFGPILRTVAEDLATAAAVVAVHTSYQADEAYQASQGFLETTITLPRLPGPDSLGEVLDVRVRAALGEPELPRSVAMTSAAVDALYNYYLSAEGSIREALRRANDALAYACDDAAEIVDAIHVATALTS